MSNIAKILAQPLIQMLYICLETPVEALAYYRRVAEKLSEDVDDPTILENYDQKISKTIDYYTEHFATMSTQELAACYMKMRDDND